MTLRITVALGTTKFAFGRLERLLTVIKGFEAGVAMEQAVQDKSKLWSYSFTTSNRDLPRLRRLLNKKGRFKILKVDDLEYGQTITDGATPGR